MTERLKRSIAAIAGHTRDARETGDTIAESAFLQRAVRVGEPVIVSDPGDEIEPIWKAQQRAGTSLL